MNTSSPNPHNHLLTMKEETMVCATCGHEVKKCGPTAICQILHEGEELYFCGNCGDTGSHQPAVEASKWIAARKLMGLPSEINSY